MRFRHVFLVGLTACVLPGGEIEASPDQAPSSATANTCACASALTREPTIVRTTCAGVPGGHWIALARFDARLTPEQLSSARVLLCRSDAWARDSNLCQVVGSFAVSAGKIEVECPVIAVEPLEPPSIAGTAPYDVTVVLP